MEDKQAQLKNESLKPTPAAGMNRIPPDLITKISSFLSLNHLLVLELIANRTRSKMISRKSAY